jgi:vitamin B12 transporter
MNHGLLSLPIVIISLIIANSADAENVDNDIPTMDPVVVTATRSPINKADAAANITIITAEQMAQMPATTVAQALEYIPGISVQFNGGPGSDAGGIRIQGSETRHVAIYQDGVPLNQLVNPRTDLSVVPLHSVERIEIYKGAASSAWGSGLGGVINIISKEPETKKPIAAGVQASYGTHQHFKAQADISGRQDKLSWLLSYTHEQNDGFIEHTDYNLESVYAKLDYAINDTNHINFALSHTQGQVADPVLNYPDFWDDIERQHTYQRLLWTSTPTNDLVLTIEGRHRESETFIEDVYSDRREVYLDYEEELWGGSARLEWNASKDNTVVMGFDGNWGSFEWAPFVDPRRTDETGEWALYANDTFNLGALTLNAGARHDNNQDFGTAFSPSFGAVYGFSKVDALIRVQVAKGFSAPDFGQVNDPTYGNPDLKPESVVNYQLGGELYPTHWLDLEVNVFRANVTDLIQFDSGTLRYKNVEKATRTGFEWALTARFDKGLTARIGGSHVDVIDDTTDEEIEDIPKVQYNFSLIYSPNPMSHSLLGKYIDNNSSYPETRDQVFLFDYLVKVKLPKTKLKGNWSLYGAVYNLFNTDYLYREVWPQPGRWGEAGVRCEI